MGGIHQTSVRRIRTGGLAVGGMLAILALAGCAGDDSSGPGASGPVWAADGVSGADSAPAELHQPIANVTAVNLSIWNNVLSQYIVTNVSLTQQPNLTWQGLFTGLPRHASLTYEAEGLVGAAVHFTGQTTATISAATGAVQVVLRPATGTPFTMPKVTAITNPSPIESGGSANFVFFIAGQPNEALTWTVASVNGATNTWGNAAARTGSITLDGSGTGSVTKSYGPPGTNPPTNPAVDVFTHQFDITNLATGITFRAYFTSRSCNLAVNPTCT